MKVRLMIVVAFWAASGAVRADWSGWMAFEHRWFVENAAFPGQSDNSASLAAQPEYVREWAEGRHRLTVTPFVRWDQQDENRRHGDIREFLWQTFEPGRELRFGIGKVFWGVTESQHLVDIINQTDLVEDPDGEIKLGQPMAMINRINDWGSWQLFVMPAFRERTFPGQKGRFRTHPTVTTTHARFETEDKARHVDIAARWSHYLGDWDIGLSHFAGTSRDPALLPEVINDQLALVPYYAQIRQSGIDLQLTKGAWLWKLEAVARHGGLPSYVAATGGFEHTRYGIAGTVADLGILLEYLYNSRGDEANSPFEDDFFLGARLAFNDAASSELLVGMIADLSDESRAYRLELAHRLTHGFSLRLNGRAFSNIPLNSTLRALEKDDSVQLELLYSF